MTIYSFVPFELAFLAGVFLGIEMFRRYGWIGAILGILMGFFGVIAVFVVGYWFRQLIRRK
jgi:hypothetical protein